VLAIAPSDDGPAPRAFALPDQPTGIVTTPEAVWVAAPQAGSVLRLDPESGRLGAPVRTGGAPARLAAGAQSLWAVDTARATLLPIQRDPPQAYDAIAVGADATDVAVAAGAIWVLSSPEGVVRVIEPGGRAVRELDVGIDAVDLAAGGGWIAVAGAGTGTLTRIDAGRRRVSGPPVSLGGLPAAVAVSDGSAWVADASGGTVARVDLVTGERRGASIAVGGQPIAVAADGDDVYVLCRRDRMLVHVDGATGEVRSRRATGGDPAALALDAAYIWVADSGEDRVLRFER
jgi:DNA-binding beta-propeller fold protein YncE